MSCVGFWQGSRVVQAFKGTDDRSVLASLAALASAGGAEHTLLDVGSLPGCGELCLETMLQVSCKL